MDAGRIGGVVHECIQEFPRLKHRQIQDWVTPFCAHSGIAVRRIWVRKWGDNGSIIGEGPTKAKLFVFVFLMCSIQPQFKTSRVGK